jgi:hydroxymethylglutaryl-CoA synthase
MESGDSPVTVTFVDFEGGGRIMCEMTDRDVEAVAVGMPVEMTFRRLYYVNGVYNYWWKCRPVRCQLPGTED